MRDDILRNFFVIFDSILRENSWPFFILEKDMGARKGSQGQGIGKICSGDTMAMGSRRGTAVNVDFGEGNQTSPSELFHGRKTSRGRQHAGKMGRS